MKIIRHSLILFAVAAGALAATTSAQESYPNKPIHFIVPFPPGGGSDGISRQVLEQITSATGWTFVVENRPGAGGNLGLDMVAKSKPDGYTLGMAQTANLGINPTLYGKMPYDARDDFSAIGLVGSQAVLVVVRAQSPYRNLQDLLEDAKKRPGSLTMASPGNGSVGHLSGELLARRADVRWTHVPYKGSSPALNDLYGGQIDFMVTSPQGVISQIKSGKMRALAITSTKRSPTLASVPTVSEAGYPEFAAMDWKGMVGPRGLPASVLATLNKQLQAALAAPTLIEKIESEGGSPLGGSSTQMADFVANEIPRWGKIVKESGASAD